MFPFLVIALIIVVIFIGPYFTILALNTLFGLGIEVNIGTWFAALWIMLVIGAAKGSSK
jgi:hypothetical protein